MLIYHLYKSNKPTDLIINIVSVAYFHGSVTALYLQHYLMDDRHIFDTILVPSDTTIDFIRYVGLYDLYFAV